jgi:hypothetical protein
MMKEERAFPHYLPGAGKNDKTELVIGSQLIMEKEQREGKNPDGCSYFY